MLLTGCVFVQIVLIWTGVDMSTSLLQHCQYFINNSCPVVCWCCIKPSLALNLSALSLYFHLAPCKPCSDAEILLAVCTSDFGKSVLRIQGFPPFLWCAEMFGHVAGVSIPSLCYVLFFFQWLGAASRRWSEKRSTRLSVWRSAVSTGRRPRSLHLGG